MCESWLQQTIKSRDARMRLTVLQEARDTCSVQKDVNRVDGVAP